MKRILSFQALNPILFSFGLVLFSSLSSLEQGRCTTAATRTVPTNYFNSENIINAATTIDNKRIFSNTVNVSPNVFANYVAIFPIGRNS